MSAFDAVAAPALTPSTTLTSAAEAVMSASPYKLVYHQGLALTDPGVMVELL